MATYRLKRKLYALPLVPALVTGVKALGAGALRAVGSKAAIAHIGKEVATGAAVNKGIEMVGGLLSNKDE